jgi:hypothetical protein
VLLCLSLTLAADGARLRVPELGLVVEGPEELLAGTRDLARLSEDWLTRLLGPAPVTPGAWVHIRFGSDLPATPEPLAAHLAPDARLSELAHCLAERQILRRVRALQPAGQPGALDWLAAAVTHRVLTSPAPGSSVRAELVPFTLATGVPRPSVKRLLETPPPAPQGPLFALYARYCDLLVGVLERGARGQAARLPRIFALQAAGRAPWPAMELVLAGQLPPGDDAQSWFERESQALARAQQRMARTDDVCARLAQLQRVAAVVTGPHGSVATHDVTLDQIAAGDAPFELRPEEIDALYRGLFLLLRDAPPLLQPPLQRHLQAVEALSKGQRRTFRRHLGAATAEFAEALVRQRRLEAYLDQIELHVAPRPEALLNLLLPLAAESRERRRGWHPELHSYLDGFE